MSLAGLEPLRLRTLRHFGGWRERRTAPLATPVATVATTALATTALPTTALPTTTVATTTVAATALATTAVAPGPTAIVAPSAGDVTAGTALAVASGRALAALAPRPRLDDRLELALDGQQLEHVVAGLLLATLHHLQHGDPVDLLLDLHLQLVADGRP